MAQKAKPGRQSKTAPARKKMPGKPGMHLPGCKNGGCKGC